jgi:hypothetical protein
MYHSCEQDTQKYIEIIDFKSITSKQETSRESAEKQIMIKVNSIWKEGFELNPMGRQYHNNGRRSKDTKI